jgi:multidrug resistance protein, MATE family
MNVVLDAPPAPSAPLRLATLLSLAWPIVLSRATQSAVGFCDALMTAPLGENALAAAATGALNTFAVMILPIGTVFIVQSFAAQLGGKNDFAAARRYAWYGLILAALSMLLALAAMPLLPRAMGLFQFTPGVRSLLSEYMQIRLLSVGAVVGTEALGNWYGGLGNTRLQMIASVVVMVLNILLNWVFIYGHLGAPAMGVAGAALASTISTWIGFFVVAVSMWRGWGGAGRHHGPLGLRRRELWRMLRFGLPNGLNWFLEFSAFVIFMDVVVADLGTVPIAAINVAMSINSVSFMPAFGMASAGAILVGQTVGRGQRDHVWPIVWLTMKVTVAWMVAVGLIYFAIPRVLVGWFAPPTERGPELLAVGATMLVIASAWQLFDGVNMVLSEALRAAGDTVWCLWARIGVAWLVFVPASIVAVRVLGGGVVSAMMCLVGWIALLAVAYAWRFRSGAWRRIDLVGESAPILD